ncbi:hypothetical protein DXV75_11830 [Alteromonas aestuariivivens]|uniref:Transglycosylase SLT domain-containing protein n=1 Tax=Alteromonas aestuariivivens TaxID=1938339 RepID=A0A3D8M4V2_9ALTE|nr:transglycosylase SLT domain-containing protein [Alteromonas aestuariivivens]RDV24763.1 hypothetical protein DXV75_11830 [Alteromonas aestuariivivens]
MKQPILVRFYARLPLRLSLWKLVSALALSLWAIPFAVSQQSVTLTEQEQAFKARYQAQFEAFKAQRVREFTEFKLAYNQRLSAYRQKLLMQWGEVEVSDTEKVVLYTEPEVKTVVDFESQTVVVSILHQSDTPPSAEQVVHALKSTNTLANAETNTGILDSFSAQPAANLAFKDLVNRAEISRVKPEINDQDLEEELQYMEALSAQDNQQIDILTQDLPVNEPIIENAKAVLGTSKETMKKSITAQVESNQEAPEQLTNKSITRFKIPIQSKSSDQRLNSVRRYVYQNAEKWKLPPELIVAVIHTESSFNPLAESHIPAYGLMQIVPTSAGIDINDYLNKKRMPMDKDLLFKPDENVLAGSTYLYLLNNRYLKNLSDSQSRLYCVIAAYNTGVGNVARALSEGENKKLTAELVEKINAMPSEDVYQALIEHLPYEETRRYLEKVTTRMTEYKPLI